jgi:DNA repair photolyase
VTYMYKDTKTWNPFKGCGFDCIYCKKSFQLQAKRQKRNCMKCYNYEPHMHDERLNSIPKADLVFACGNGDISFASDGEKRVILSVMERHPRQTFLLQTKAPHCLYGYRIPSNVIVGTTIETNRDTKHISKAPSTERRYRTLRNLDCRKAVTVEPILDLNFGWFGEEIGTAMSIYQVVVISSLLRRRCKTYGCN